MLIGYPQRGGGSPSPARWSSRWREGASRVGGPEAVGGTDVGSQALGLHPAQGGLVELTFPEPGRYPFVNHVMADGEMGAHGVVRVR